MFFTDVLTAFHARLGIPPFQWHLADRTGALHTCHYVTPLAVQADGGINRVGAGEKIIHAPTISTTFPHHFFRRSLVDIQALLLSPLCSGPDSDSSIP